MLCDRGVTRIRDVLGCNLGLDNGYPDKFLVVFFRLVTRIPGLG
jgi:hypothetical protein